MKTLFFAFLVTIFSVVILQTATAKELSSGFSRVMKTDTIRCGFQYWDGGVMRNEETGDLIGFFVEYTEYLAKAADLNVEWVGPTEWSNIGAELRTGKIDAWCAGTWLSARNSKFMLVSETPVYNGFEAFVRGDDTRFDDDPSLLNDPSVTMAILDGTSSGQISKGIFPKAILYDLPPLTATDIDLILNVAMGKADVAFTNPGIVNQYMKNNQGKIKRLRPNKPYAIMGTTFTVHEDDFRLLHFFNTGIKELKNTGFTARLIEKYNVQYPGLFVPMEGMN